MLLVVSPFKCLNLLLLTHHIGFDQVIVPNITIAFFRNDAREIIPNNTRIIRNNTSYPSEQYKHIRPAVVPDSRASPLCHALLSHLLLPLLNLPLNLLDHLCQLLLALFSGLRIDIPPDPLAVGTSGRVFALPEVVVQLVDAAGAGLAVLALVGLEAALV